MQSNSSYQINRNAQSSISFSQIRQGFNDWVKKLLPIGQGSKISQRGKQELESSNSATGNSDAVFLAWQEIPSGEIFALYNVIAKQHPLYNSTVSEVTLRQQQLKIPPTPFPPGHLMKLDFEK